MHPPPCTPSVYLSAYPLCIPPPHTPLHTPPCTPSTYPLCVPLHVPLCIPPPCTSSAYLSVYPLHIPPLCTPLCTPFAYPSAYPSSYPSTYPLCVPPLCTPSTYLNESDWLMSLILISFPTTSLKSLHAARIDKLAYSNEPAIIIYYTASTGQIVQRHTSGAQGAQGRHNEVI